MSELKRFDMNGTPHVNGHYCNAQEAADLIEQLQQRNKELAATVERLLEFDMTPDEFHHISNSERYKQNLNHVKREVYADGYYDGYRMAWLYDHDSKADHDEYASEQSEIEAEKLYPSDKEQP